MVYVTSTAPAYAAAVTQETRARIAETRRILSVVERTVDNGQVVARVRQKLSTLDDKRLRLLGTLADRLDTDRGTPRTARRSPKCLRTMAETQLIPLVSGIFPGPYRGETSLKRTRG
ncbi:MAG: hypothetical protein AUH14_04855 [Candidatus Rokubacteria bacterium 13_2_20CM_69_15_1]|nr:MAG: hypothetical protein AUH14_04855 [Candidatus Rokubacteria bacterium 13_2_20CM_69_15_1]